MATAALTGEPGVWLVTADDGTERTVGLPEAVTTEAEALAAVATMDAQAQADLEARRALMVCSRLQGRLVLGPLMCATIDALAADPATPWAMREAIVNAVEWQRLSETMDELAYLLSFPTEQMDALFEIAMTVAV